MYVINIRKLQMFECEILCNDTCKNQLNHFGNLFLLGQTNKILQMIVAKMTLPNVEDFDQSHIFYETSSTCTKSTKQLTIDSHELETLTLRKCQNLSKNIAMSRPHI